VISFSCDCGKAFEVDEQYAGRKIKCKQCGQALHVPEPPQELPEAIRKKIGGAKQKRQLYYILGVVGGMMLGGLPALFVLAHWLKQDLTCDACGFKTNVDTLEEFIGYCPECAGAYFSGNPVWSKTNYVVPLIAVTVTSTTDQKNQFRGEEGWNIVVSRKRFDNVA
jgi:hypothetical protein